MTATTWIALAVMAVLVVLYMMRRRTRLDRED
jgi:cytochrome oxidase assembly protein ShyY1